MQASHPPCHAPSAAFPVLSPFTSMRDAQDDPNERLIRAQRDGAQPDIADRFIQFKRKQAAQTAYAKPRHLVLRGNYNLTIILCC
jgi:hypothetical protein